MSPQAAFCKAKLDMTDLGETGKLAQDAVRAFGRIDVLVNNAGTRSSAHSECSV
jgi:NAD(P)-dependent dehydrogenase (short-subunit alcohol dehydrogenase family)